MSCDIVVVGIGGQGVVTIGDLLLRSAFETDLPASFCPTKGMAQRGGFVKVELRLGRERAGPRIGDGAADLVVSLERSESLRALRYVQAGGSFLLFDDVWEPTHVMLGVDPYPSRRQVVAEIVQVAETAIVLDPAQRPEADGHPVAANVYVLGAMLAVPALSRILDAAAVERVVAERWPNAADANRTALHAGRERIHRELG